MSSAKKAGIRFVSCLHVNRNLSASFHSATADSEMERMRNGAGTAEADGNDSRKRECIATFVRASPKFFTHTKQSLSHSHFHFRQLKFIVPGRKNRLHAATHFQSEVNKFFWLGIRGSVKSISFHRNLTNKVPSAWRDKNFWLEVTAKTLCQISRALTRSVPNTVRLVLSTGHLRVPMDTQMLCA